MSPTSSGVLAPIRNPMVAEQGSCLYPGVLAVQPLEAEDEFERARR